MSAPRILVFRNGHIGNTLVAVPLLRALRRHWPRATIDVVVDGLPREVLIDCPYVTSLIEYERHRPDPWLRTHVTLVRRLRRSRYDIALLPKRFFRNELLAWLTGAGKRVGFHTPGARPFRLTDTVPYREGVPIVSLLLELLAPLRVPPAGEDLEFWWKPADEDRVAALAQEAGVDLQRPFVIFHTEAATQGTRRVSRAVFAEAADRLRREHDVSGVFLFGPGEEAAAGEIRERLAHSALLLVGERMGAVAAAMARAAAFAGHDSGPAHLARAVGLGGVVIYSMDPGWEEHRRKWGAGEGLRPVPRAGMDGAALTAHLRERIALS